MENKAAREAKIDELIRARRLVLARKEITLFLREREHDANSRLKASEFYRRISDFSQGLRVLGEELSISQPDQLSSLEARLQIQLARLLNLLGSSSFALRILEKLSKTVPNEAWPQCSGILVSNYRYSEALPYLRHLETDSNEESSYASRFQLISLADCYFGLGDFERARDLLKFAIQISKEPLLHAVANQAMGAYHVLQDRLSEGEKSLEKALALFPEKDVTLDYGYLQKWIGALRAKQGKLELAKKHLESSLRILYRAGQKPEAWLEVLYWFGFIQFKKNRKFPAEWAQIISYPGPKGSRLSQWIASETETPKVFETGSDRTRRVLFDLESDVRIDRTRNGEKHSLYLNDPDRLIAILRLAGHHGIPQYRVYEAMWPSELFSFKQHQKRLEQLVMKARKEQRMAWSKLHLQLENPIQQISCRWTQATRPKGWIFLKQTPQFTAAEVARFFSLSKRSAEYLCNEWLSSGATRVESTKGRRRTFCRP